MKKIHYGWIIIGVGVLVKMTGLGFGRFAYPMLIPNMRGSLGFNYIEMGLLSGTIMLGYLIFSLIGGMLATRFGPKRIVVASLLCGAHHAGLPYLLPDWWNVGHTIWSQKDCGCLPPVWSPFYGLHQQISRILSSSLLHLCDGSRGGRISYFHDHFAYGMV